MANGLEVESILAADCGSTMTKVILIDKIDGQYRFVAEGEALSTIEPPRADVLLGVRHAIGQIEEASGRLLLDEQGQLITPEQANGNGVDAFVATTSAATPLRLILAGLTRDVSIESARRAISSTYALVEDTISLDDGTEGERRSAEARIRILQRHKPDAVLIVGGTDGGAVAPVADIAEVVALACSIMDSATRPQIIFAGNKEARPSMAEILGNKTELHAVNNVRPTLDVEDLTMAQEEINNLYQERKMARIPGFGNLSAWSPAPILPTARAFGYLMKYLARQYGLNVVGVDIGGTTALDAGIIHISTAPNYQNGRVEKFVGRIIKNYKREEIILATDGTPQPFDPRSGLFSKDTDVARFEKDFEKSLKRLDVDYVDIFYLSNCARKESVMFEPLMKSMDKFRRSGKARFLGIATHSFVPEAVRAAADSAFYDVAMLAYNFQIRNIEERKEAVAYAAGKGMGLVAMKAITGESWVASRQQAVSHPKAALKWVLQNENIHTTVPGITSYEQLQTDLDVMEDLTFTTEEKKYLQLACARTEGSLFCQGCGSCLEQCSQAPDLPTLMRCYMYAYGYRDLAAAVRNIGFVKDDRIACAACASCVVRCPMGFDVRAKTLDIIRLKRGTFPEVPPFA